MRPRYASRYLLLVEIFAGVVMFSWGIAGWAMGGALWGVLDRALLNTAWGVTLCGLGALQFVVAFVELVIGRRWPDPLLLLSVSTRCGLAFIGMAVWFYVLHVAVTMGGVSLVAPLICQAPMGILISAAIFAGNLRVRCLLDPKLDTDRLEQQIQRERQYVERRGLVR